MAITLAVPPELSATFTHRAGQHVTVRHHADGRELRRSYSVCPPVGDPAQLRLVVRKLGPGGFADHATGTLAEGDILEVGPPTGGFGPAADPGAHHVMIAGGSGVTPLLAMAAAVLRDDPVCRVSFLYASRDTGSVLLAEDVADLKDAHVGRFCPLHVLSREAQVTALLSGRIDAARLWYLLSVLEAEPAADTHYYLCGPWGLLSTAHDALLRWRADPDRVHQELFTTEDGPTAPPAGGPVVRGRPVTVRLGGRTTTAATDPSDSSLLDTVVRARPDVPYSCRDGLCGTCRAKLIAGTARMDRQFALGPQEVADGYVLTCRATTESDEVELDFDA
ncbi:2Fe-2S iron-sulfur cluster-binding protein [Streptomyces tendae]|uniref:2Fe-2S iron-sulfur cluster-binding protein n=1 Tax=Streptomyces tendae TaxID=1932 RepID=UPI00367FD6B0